MNAEWDVFVEGMNYHVSYEKNKVFVNGEKLKKLTTAKGSSMVETAYYVPVGSVKAVLYIPAGKGGNTAPTLTIDGIDVVSGQKYEPTKMPGWIYAFLVFYVLYFILLIGGALGAVINSALFALSARIASNKNKSTVSRVLICLGIAIAAGVVELVAALVLYSAIYS